MTLVMDVDTIEGLNEIRPSVFRVSMKLLSLQKLCHMDIVSLGHVSSALQSVGGAALQLDVALNREEVTLALNRMFHSVSEEVPHHMSVEAPEKLCCLMFRLFDCSRTGSVSAASLRTALIVLSADILLLKYRALVSVAETSSGSISRSGLRSLLQDLSQVPLAVQEEVVFGGVEAAVRSCFNGVLTSTASEEHVLSWLQSEPPLLLWLPTLYRLSISENVSHRVRCHSCKTFPIIGLRYRCMKCVNIHVCQSCFVSNRQTRKHKSHHPVLEFCTQPNWRESLSSLVHSARYALLPRQYPQHRRRNLMWVESAGTQNSASPHTDPSTRLATSTVSRCASSGVSHDALFSSKCLQTDKETQPEQSKVSALLTEVRNLQRDKWLLEQQLQAWRLTVQSEQGILEDRCSEMEVTMETLRKQNVCLQGMLTQALNKMEAQQHENNILQCVAVETENDLSPTSDTERNTDDEEEDEEELVKMDDIGTEEELPSPSPTMHHGFLCHPVGKQDGPEEVGPMKEDTCLSAEEEDCGTCSPESLLQETVEKLKTVMETHRWRERQTGERKSAELLEAADEVGDSIHHLVNAVKRNTDTHS